MSVASIEWRLDGCGADCMPRQHDPADHERYGRLLELKRGLARPVHAGPMVIDLEDRCVMVGDDEVALSPTEWEILAILARNAGRLVAYGDILAGVWGDGYEYGQIVRVSMARLRAKLGSAGHLIETRRGHGFRLTDGSRPSPLPTRTPGPRRWARAWNACQWCHETERAHFARGLCTRCYKRARKAGRRT